MGFVRDELLIVVSGSGNPVGRALGTMCGFAGFFGAGAGRADLWGAARALEHRGPDDFGFHEDGLGRARLAHRRLSVVGLGSEGRQPMAGGPGGRLRIVFNGEIYNYLELRRELSGGDWGFRFGTGTDTEVLLAAWRAWGPGCLDRLIGMFAFAVWDEAEGALFAARDRFGVKPLYAHEPAEGGVWLASEIRALHAAGLRVSADEGAWSDYLGRGLYDHDPGRTFWRGARAVPAGGWLRWECDAGAERGGAGRLTEGRWYDAAAAAKGAGPDDRSDGEVDEELGELLRDSVRLRFRADVPVGVCLSGGLDSSLLLGLAARERGGGELFAFHFACGDERYDETPWVREAAAHIGGARLEVSTLDARGAAESAGAAARAQGEPFGGIPTLGMGRVHARARELGVVVLLDGNGLDEGWGGYETYRRAEVPGEGAGGALAIQGARSSGAWPEVLRGDFAGLGAGLAEERPFGERVADLRYRDLTRTKIPRAMRFADRASMEHSRELREPFLDHRIVELGLRQPAVRLIEGDRGKMPARRAARGLLPAGVGEAPKRAVQTPQREWLRGPLADWAEGMIEAALGGGGPIPAREWCDPDRVRARWRAFREGEGDNGFPPWQWINIGLLNLHYP